MGGLKFMGRQIYTTGGYGINRLQKVFNSRVNRKFTLTRKKKPKKRR